MKTLYADEPRFETGLSIFLAGPTPRAKDVPSWRPEAIKTLEALGFTGTVLIPERKDWSVKFEYTDQIEWEHAGLTGATAILFWVPRRMDTMPALTTNIEFGYWIAKDAAKLVYGRPDDAVSVRYLDEMYKKYNGSDIPNTLEGSLRAALALATKRTS